MTRGLRLEFSSDPPLSLQPPDHILPSKSQLPIIRSFIPDLLSRNIIRIISSPQPLFFSRPFTVEKKDGPFRLILDLSFEQFSTCSPFQDGVCSSNRLWDCGTSVGLYPGSPGRIFPCSHGLVFPQVPCFCGGRNNICLPVSPLWPLSSSLGIPSSYQACESSPSSSINEGSLLFGRFPFPQSFQGGSLGPHYTHLGHVRQTSHQGQLQEVVPRAISNSRIPGSYSSTGFNDTLHPSLQSFGHHNSAIS